MAVDAVQRTEELIRLQTRLLGSLPLAAIATRLDGTVVFWNQAAQELYGWSAAEVVGRSIMDLLVPEEAVQQGAEIMDLVRAGKSWSGEFTVKRSNGTTFTASVTDSPIIDDDGALIGILGVSLDLTARQQAAEARRKSEEDFRTLANSLPELCWMANPDGHIFWFNERWYEYTGTRPEQMEGWGWQAVHDPKVLPEVLEKWRASIGTGQAFEMVFPLRSANGEFRHFLTRIRPMKDESGKVLRWFGTNTDISEQKRVEEALREGEERLRAAFSQTYSFLVLLDLQGTIIEVNRAAQEAAGCGREEMIGRKMWEPWWSALPEETAILKASIAKAANGENVREECYFCLPDGTKRFADRTLSPVKDANGRVRMVVATGLDMTEQKDLLDQLEARVKERTHELEEKNKALLEQTETVRELSGRLLQSQDEERRRIARELHDGVGQLLAAVGMNLSRVEAEKGKLSPSVARCVEENSRMLQQVTGEIRTVSHLLHPPLLDEVGLESALRWYVEGFAERSKVSVNLELPQDLERLPQECELTLFRVVQECLTNIHRHSGSSTATVRISRNDTEAKLEVKDDGGGMSQKRQMEIYSGESSGVGLRGMRERMRQIGGTLGIQSSAIGTSITVVLPLAGKTRTANESR